MAIWDDVHGNLALKTCVEEILGFELSKELPTSDWKAKKLTDAQIEYTGLDGITCIRLYEVLMDTLDRKSVEIGQDIPVAWHIQQQVQVWGTDKNQTWMGRLRSYMEDKRLDTSRTQASVQHR
ncbi:hypothetical protein DFH09DRAFT_1076847 [Mycena vulgaris]|nr:hypothetical protein DFH09DRAFT_1076847 [Mycena vulgaris]